MPWMQRQQQARTGREGRLSMSAYTDEVRARHAAHEKRQTMGATFYQFRAASHGAPPVKLFYHLDPAERK